MAVRHRLTVESCRLGHVVTCSSRRAVARNWGGKGEPTAAGQRIETLWRQFFSDPSQWWDCRSEIATARYPDFKHKMTQDSLCIGHRRNPQWVDAKLAAMAPGTVQLDRLSWNRRLASMEYAQRVFNNMQSHDVVTWTTMILGHMKCGQGQKALELF